MQDPLPQGAGRIEFREEQGRRCGITGRARSLSARVAAQRFRGQYAQGDAEVVEVGRDGERTALNHLGRGVADCTAMALTITFEERGQSEVHDLEACGRRALLDIRDDQEIRGFDVSVHQSRAVQGLESLGDAQRDIENCRDATAAHGIVRRQPGHELHRDVAAPFGAETQLMHRDDRRVPESREHLELAFERVTRGPRQVQVEPLERALRAAGVVEREPHLAHSTLAQHANQPEPACETLHPTPSP